MQRKLFTDRLSAIPTMTSHGIFNRIVRLQGYRCVVCGSVNPHLTIDHKYQKSKGGTNDTNNLQLLCLSDHRKKDNIGRKIKLKKIPIFQFPIR